MLILAKGCCDDVFCFGIGWLAECPAMPFWVSIYGLGVEQRDSERDLRVKVWTATKNEYEDRLQSRKQLLTNEVNTRASRGWRSKCLCNCQDHAPMPISSRSSVSSLVKPFSVGRATKVSILRSPIPFATPDSANRYLQCGQCRRAWVS